MRDGFIRKKVQKVVSKTGVQIKMLNSLNGPARGGQWYSDAFQRHNPQLKIGPSSSNSYRDVLQNK